MSVKSIQAGDYLKSNSCKDEHSQERYSKQKRTNNSSSTVRPGAVRTVSPISAVNHQAQIDNWSNSMGDEDTTNAFAIGSIVIVETGWGHTFEGEVISFDYKYKILFLKCPALSGNATRNDIHLVNLDCAKNVRIKKEAKKKDQINFPSIEIDKVELRKNNAIDERKRLVEAFSAGINEDGLKLYLHLSKTLKTTFEGKNIIVMNDVVIAPPYKVDNCTVTVASNEKKLKGEGAVSYVKQLVEKFWSEY